MKIYEIRKEEYMKERLVLIGAGGYAKSVIDSIDEKKYQIMGFIDDIKSGVHLGLPIFSDSIDNFKEKEEYVYFISIGDNVKRKYWYDRIVENGLKVINVIDKTAILASDITYGRGIFVGKAAIINSDVRIGENVIINTKALIEHGGRIGNHSNVSTNTTLNGDVVVGNNCMIGSSSVVNGQLRIGDNSIVGSGAVVIRNVEENTVVAGVPAKKIK